MNPSMTSELASPATPSAAAGPAPFAHEMLAAQALLRPEALAVSRGTEALTWRQLEQSSNRLAHHLKALGVGREVPVALYFERSPAFVVGALAVLKAGGAYLPLDPAYPPERIDAILRDAQTPLLLSHKWMAAGLHSGPWTNVDVDMDAPRINPQPDSPLQIDVAPGDLAYLIYTSGSTGQPKGVEVTHGNLSHLIGWHTRAFSVNQADRASQVAGLAFDASVWEIWCHLAAGASLHLIDETSRRSPEGLRDWLVRERITLAFVPTVLAEQLIALEWPSTTALRIMLTGADTLHRYPPVNLPFTLINNYGPTECTVLVTSGVVSPAPDQNHLPALGRPIDDTRIYIVDDALRPVAEGEAGELCAAGPQVGRGYRNQAALTAQKFLDDPFSPGQRLFRTGDRARRLSNGEFAFLGRIDDQIKIRGYRVEPDEIAGRLNQHPEVAGSAVIARDSAQGDRQLVAYLVLTPETTLTGQQLREFLGARLPEYMIPSAFVRLPALPLTTNGKCDRDALPAPSSENMVSESGAPLDVSAAAATEARLTELVNGLMAPRRIAREDNFFFVGGHSMLAAQLLARIREAFGASLTLRQLFEAPTIANLAAVLDRHLSA